MNYESVHSESSGKIAENIVSSWGLNTICLCQGKSKLKFKKS